MIGNRVTLMCDNATVVTHINKQGGTRSRELASLTMEVHLWVERHQFSLQARFIPGKNNVLAD